MAVLKRSESPMPLAASDCSRRQSFINFSAPGHHQIISFPQFPYENALGSFNLPRMGAQSPTESDPPSIYSHHPSASYHLNPTTHSGFSSPASTHSSPNPYGDFNAFPPLSPVNTGATLSSLITQPQNSSHGHLAHLPHQPPLTFDLSSTISSSTSCEIPHSSHPCELPLNRHARRESYSTTVTDPSYERRHSTVSVGSIRCLHSSSPYTNYTTLDTNPSAQSQIYTLAGDLPNQGVFYMDSGHHGVPPSSEMTGSNLIQPGLMSDVPRLTQSHISHGNSNMPTIQPGKNTTRQYRKKTPPDSCAVCDVKQTPEWRKGPSGLRTLCNACGLTAAKHSLKAPTCIEEVWAQLREIGLSRHRGKYELSAQKKAAAARNWSSQSQVTGRTSNDGPYYKTSSTPSPSNTSSSRSCRSPFPNVNGTNTKIPNNGNLPELDGAPQMFAVNRGRGNSLSGAPPGGSSTPRNVAPMYSYSVTCSPHAASLNMSPMNETHPPPSGRFPHPLSSPLCDSPGQILEFYASPLHAANGMNPQDSRLNSIGGHRMSISSIINHDHPTQSRSCFDNNNAQVQPFHQQHQTQHLHHQFFLQHPPQST